MRKSDQRRSRHLETLQHTVIHQRHALRRHPFIVELVVAQKVLLPELFHRRIVSNAQKFRQDLLADFFRKRLPFGHVFLTVAFGAMAKDFVEKYRRCAPRQQRRSNRRIVDGRGDQSFQLLAHRRFCRVHRFVVRCVLGVYPIKIVVAVDVHSVRRLALDEQLQPVANLSVLQLRPFAGYLIRVLRLRRERHDGIDDRRRFAKRLGIRTDSLLPRFAVHRDRNLRPDRNVRFFPRKIRRSPFRRFYFYFLARLDLDQRFGCGPVLLVGLQPDRPPQHLSIIVDRYWRARSTALLLPLADLVRIVQRVRSRPNRYFQPAVPRFVAVQQRPVRTGHVHALRLCDRISHVISRGIQRAQCLHGAFHLRLQRREHWRALGLRIRWRSVRRWRNTRKQRQRTKARNRATTN